MFSAPHTATVERMVQLYNIAYEAGTTGFVAGATVTGGTSHATATVVSTGSVTSGLLAIHSIIGTFQSGETLDDNGATPGHAHSTSVVTASRDSYGQLLKTNITSSVSCRFFNMVVSKPQIGGVTYVQDNLAVMLPPTTTIGNGDTLTSIDAGYSDTFTICELKPVYALGSLHHYTSKLTRAP